MAQAEATLEAPVSVEETAPQESTSESAPSETRETPPAPEPREKPSNGKAIAASMNALIRGTQQVAGENASETGEEGKSAAREQRNGADLLNKPLATMSAEELREAAKQRPELFRVWQSESDKQRASSNGQQPQQQQPEATQDQVQHAQKVLDTAVATVFGVVDRDILNGVLWERLPDEEKVKLHSKDFGTGGKARRAAAEAFLDAHVSAAKRAGREEFEAEVMKNGGLRQTLLKRANAETREQESSDDLPNADRNVSSAAATPTRSTSSLMNNLIRSGRK